MPVKFDPHKGMGLRMFGFSRSEPPTRASEGTQRDSVKDYVAMGFTQGTAVQLAHVKAHLMRDLGQSAAPAERE